MEDKDKELFDNNYLKGYEYETLMNALHVSVFKCLLNEEFTAIWCNNYFFESTGYTKEEYISLYHYSIRDYFSSMGDEYKQIAEIVLESYQQGLPGFECVSRMPQKEGTFIWIKVVGTFTNELYDGIPVLYVVYTDITDVIEQQELSKRLEERSEMLRVALDEAKQANNAKSDFLSRMSHDIRTPLNAIIGMTEIADNHLDDPEKMHDCHKKIALSSQHLLGLINDVLDMSKIESGKMTLNNGNVFLPELIGDVVNIMQPDIKAKNQFFKVYSHNIQHETICTDALRLHQIFLNILSNATKFTPHEGKIIFEIKEIGCQNEDKVFMEFSFSDTGIGIREEFIDHIFDTFTREQDSRVDKTIGSGLGMAITKRIVGILGGDIQVSSIVGKGTTFKVTLPFQISHIPPIDEQDKLDDLHILFIDDDSKDCQCALDIFDSLHIHADCIDNEKQAMEHIIHMCNTNNNYNVILFNWKMRDFIYSPAVQKMIMENAPVMLAMTYEDENIEKEFNVSGFIKMPLFRSTLYDGIKKYVFHKNEIQEGIKKDKNFDFTGKRFLLAEDNDLNREIAIELLSSTGAQIHYAINGQQCVEMFEQSPLYYYDLIFMDIQMPIMNGYIATQNIRNLSRADAKEVQIWAMTADAFVEDVEKAKSVGMNGHFAKPLDIVAINTEISHFLIPHEKL